MPFRDQNRRREYDRVYKRQRRRAASRSAPKTSETRAYLCHRHPHYRLPGGISFHEGILVTNDPAVQDVIEEAAEFGQVIFRVALVP
jgi:hypothetical protein